MVLRISTGRRSRSAHRADSENSERIYRALLSLSLSNFGVDFFAKTAVRVRLDQRYHAELLTPSTGGPDYAEIVQSSVPAKLLNVPIRVPSRAMLVRMKLWAIAANHDGREKHLADVELLLHGGAQSASETTA